MTLKELKDSLDRFHGVYDDYEIVRDMQNDKTDAITGITEVNHEKKYLVLGATL